MPRQLAKASDWLARMGKQPFKKVCAKHRCTNCGKTNWCRYNDEFIICQREPIIGGKSGTDKNGQVFYIKALKPQKSDHLDSSSDTPRLTQEIEVASGVTLNNVYTYLSDILDLSQLHYENLLRRGLTHQQIIDGKYKTLPSGGRKNLFNKLKDKFGLDLLRTIPGIVCIDGNWTLGGAVGQTNPVRNNLGQIIAITIRADKVINKNKYLWMSSKKHGGPSSGAPVHVPLHSTPVDVVYVTEGALKADVASALSGKLVLGVAGVGNWSSSIQLLKDMKVKKINLAYDADAATNPNVASAILNFFKALRAENFNVAYVTWDLNEAKGLDDALLNKVEIKYFEDDVGLKEILQLPSLQKVDSRNNSKTKNLPCLKHGLIQMRDLIKETWDVLINANSPPSMFQKGNSIVMLQDDGKQLYLSEVDQVKMLGHLVRIADWFVDFEVVRKDLIDVKSEVSLPPKDLVKDMLSYLDNRLPVLHNVLNTPTFGKDGVLVKAPGYNESNAVYLDPNRLLQIPEVIVPRPQDIHDAVSFFRKEVFGDFPFASDKDFTHLMSALFTLILRPMIDGPTPLNDIEATTPGTGKTLMVEGISLIATGRSCDVRSIPRSEDEIRKAITSELLRGPRMIVFDNADQEGGKFHSPTMAAVLTTTSWTDRMLSQTKMLTLDNHAAWYLTGNNVQLTSELSRRSIPIKLDAGVSRPWARKSSEFVHANLRAWILENRSKLLHALLTLSHGWISAGAKPSSKTLGSFEAWAKIIGGVLEYSGLDGFLDNEESNYAQADVETADWDDFVGAWWDKFKEKPKKASELFHLIEQHELLASVIGIGSEKSRQTKLGLELANKNNRVFGNFRVKLVRNKGGHGKFYALEPMLSKVTDSGHQDQAIENNSTYEQQGDFDDLDNLFKDKNTKDSIGF